MSPEHWCLSFSLKFSFLLQNKIIKCQSNWKKCPHWGSELRKYHVESTFHDIQIILPILGRWRLESISSTFYAHVFCMKVMFWQLFLVTFWLWRQNFLQKNLWKLFIKLTPGVIGESLQITFSSKSSLVCLLNIKVFFIHC